MDSTTRLAIWAVGRLNDRADRFAAWLVLDHGRRTDEMQATGRKAVA